jgi:hypothetical protein
MTESSEELVKILELHGKEFLNSFSFPSVSAKRKREHEEHEEHETVDEEWCGIQMSSPSENEVQDGDINCYVVRRELMSFQRISNTAMTISSQIALMSWSFQIRQLIARVTAYRRHK